MFEHLTLECMQCGLPWDLMLKTLYNGHSKPGGKIPVSNGLSGRIGKDLKKRGFKQELLTISSVVFLSFLSYKNFNSVKTESEEIELCFMGEKNKKIASRDVIFR